MNRMIIFREVDYIRIPHLIKKYKNSNKEFGLEYKGVIYIDDTMSYVNDQLYNLIIVVNALNIKDKKSRVIYIYDAMCDYLDTKDYMCDFKCNECLGNRCHTSVHKSNGCCYKGGQLCPLLSNGKCSIKCLSCKLFMCSSIEKKYKFKAELENYPMLKNFYNFRQKMLIKYNFRVDRDIFIEQLIKKI